MHGSSLFYIIQRNEAVENGDAPKVFILIRLVFIYFVCTLCTDILDNKINEEISNLLQHKVTLKNFIK